MNLLDKISSKAGTLFVTGLATAVFGLMPSPGYSDGEGQLNYAIEQALKRGEIYQARWLIECEREIARKNALEEAKKQAEQKARQAEERVNRIEREETRETENRENQNINSTLLVEPIICNNYEKNKEWLREREGLREGSIAEFSSDKDKKIYLAMIIQTDKPYSAEIIINRDNGEKIDSSKWSNNEEVLSRKGGWVSYEINEWGGKGTFLVNFLVESNRQKLNMIRMVRIN